MEGLRIAILKSMEVQRILAAGNARGENGEIPRLLDLLVSTREGRMHYE
jgi:hypothetical protein